MSSNCFYSPPGAGFTIIEPDAPRPTNLKIPRAAECIGIEFGPLSIAARQCNGRTYLTYRRFERDELRWSPNISLKRFLSQARNLLCVTPKIINLTVSMEIRDRFIPISLVDYCASRRRLFSEVVPHKIEEVVLNSLLRRHPAYRCLEESIVVYLGDTDCWGFMMSGGEVFEGSIFTVKANLRQENLKHTKFVNKTLEAAAPPDRTVAHPLANKRIQAHRNRIIATLERKIHTKIEKVAGPEIKRTEVFLVCQNSLFRNLPSENNWLALKRFDQKVGCALYLSET